MPGEPTLHLPTMCLGMPSDMKSYQPIVVVSPQNPSQLSITTYRVQRPQLKSESSDSQ